MNYVIFIEVNHKQHETYYTYLQYDGNEFELSKLDDIIKDADFSGMYGEYSEFFLDINNTLSQEEIEKQCKIKFDGYYPFSFCKGKFDFSDIDFFGLDAKEKALLLDDMFYDQQINTYFS